MLSKSQMSYVRSLHQKKFRQMYGKFVVEGDKLVQELLNSNIKTDTVYCVKGYSLPATKAEVIEISETDLERISTQQTPDKIIAVANIPQPVSETASLAEGLYLLLDNINDPGNCGSIIRIADWFGVKQIFLSENSVDVYNPKVVAAAKGSLFRMTCTYTALEELINKNKHLTTYGTFMSGSNIYQTRLSGAALVVIGNEANGISKEVENLISERITIPAFGKAESLNAAVATGIVISEFRRQMA
ncbi:MAG: RNA methyltransferase [Chitinophagales bacterium]